MFIMKKIGNANPKKASIQKVSGEMYFDTTEAIKQTMAI
jgi:hypothetical protein